MIKWSKLVSEIHETLIAKKVNIKDAKVGDFEFGGLETTLNIKSNINRETGALVIVDARAIIGSKEPSTIGVVPTILWSEFIIFVEEQCILKGLNPFEIEIDHLEIRPKDISDLHIYVDVKFKTVSITDGESRINGISMTELI